MANEIWEVDGVRFKVYGNKGRFGSYQFRAVALDGQEICRGTIDDPMDPEEVKSMVSATLRLKQI